MCGDVMFASYFAVHFAQTHLVPAVVDSLRFEDIVERQIATREPDDVCPICLKVLDSNCVQLRNCQHAFCAQCIRRWLTVRSSCPVCQLEYG